jgi:hypothetical protein
VRPFELTRIRPRLVFAVETTATFACPACVAGTRSATIATANVAMAAAATMSRGWCAVVSSALGRWFRCIVFSDRVSSNVSGAFGAVRTFSNDAVRSAHGVLASPHLHLSLSAEPAGGQPLAGAPVPRRHAAPRRAACNRQRSATRTRRSRLATMTARRRRTTVSVDPAIRARRSTDERNRHSLLPRRPLERAARAVRVGHNGMSRRKPHITK